MEIVLGRDDRASPYEVSKLFDGLLGALRPRWYERLAIGADTLTLTLANDPADRRLRMLVAVRADTVDAFEHRLRATYPDIRFRPSREAHNARLDHRRSAVFDVTRLKKGRRWMWSLQTTRDYEHSLVEALAATMAGSGERCFVSLAVTPAPLLLEAFSNHQLLAHERSLNQGVMAAPVEPGVASAVEQRHIQGAVEAVGRSLAFFDLRVVVPRGRDDLARQISGIVHEARSENDLKRRRVRLRRRHLLGQIARNQPPLLPDLRTGVVSAAELATLWHLPTLRLAGVGLERSGARQIAAPPAISRNRRDAVLRDELGPVGIRREDRKFGWAILGGQRVGKSSLLLRTIGNTARDRRRALIVIDPKVDLARDALTAIPADRVVHYLDLAEPDIGFNPLTVLAARAAPAEVVADMVVTAIRETAGETAVGSRSDQFLRAAISSVCTVEEHPTLAHVHRLLDPDDPGYRDWVVRELDFHQRTDFLRDFWGRSFRARLRANPRFTAEILEAPRNKLSRFLAVPSLRTLTSHPVPLDLAGIVDRGEVLVVNGSKGAVGEDNAILVCQLIVIAVQKLLHQQQELDREQRRPVALVIDEAHNMFTPSFATMLSEGGAGGVEVTAAWQYSGQIIDERVRAGIKSLLQHITIFRLREYEDARAAAALAMTVFSDTISANDEATERLRVDPVDIVHQPNFRAVNLWIADGRPQDVFTAATVAVETALVRDAGQRLAVHHLAAQRRRTPRSTAPTQPSPPIIWSIDNPVQARQREVFIDTTGWLDRPTEPGRLIVELLPATGEPIALVLFPLDASGRRFRATVPDLVGDEASHRAGPLVVVVRSDTSSWAPLRTDRSNARVSQELPATVRISGIPAAAARPTA